jgi:hypothetical protein
VIEARRRPRRSARRRIARAAIAVLLVAVVFAFGVALGQALEEGPGPDGKITRVRTLQPLPLPPARETVTVTARSE